MIPLKFDLFPASVRRSARFIALSGVAWGVLACSGGFAPAAAQSALRNANAPLCTLAGEAIIKLHGPQFGTPTVWDVLFGDETSLVRFGAAVPLDSGNVLLAGEHLDASFTPLETIVTEINTLGRGLGEKRTVAKPKEHVTALVPADGSYVMASNIVDEKSAHKEVRLSWFDAAREYQRDVVLKDTAYNYESYAILPANEGDGVVVALHARERGKSGEEHGVLYRVSAAGKVLWQRAYRTGGAELFHGLSPIGKDAYAITGRMQINGNRTSGAVMKVNNDGTIFWQRAYPRGTTALLRATAARDDGRLVVAGQVTPFGGAYSSAWVMELDKNGEILWQRYFPMDGYETDGRGVITHADGRTTVMLNARVRNQSAEDVDNDILTRRDHIRLLTLSPRGDVLRDESYVEGQHARAHQLSAGRGGQRVVTAFVQGTPLSLAPEDVVLITEQIKRRQGRLMQQTDGKMVEEYVAPDDEKTVEEAAQSEATQAGAVNDNSEDGTDDSTPSFRGWVFVATPIPAYRDPCLPPDIPKVQDK